MNRRMLFVGYRLKPFHLASIHHTMRELRIGGGTVVLMRHLRPYFIAVPYNHAVVGILTVSHQKYVAV